MWIYGWLRCTYCRFQQLGVYFQVTGARYQCPCCSLMLAVPDRQFGEDQVGPVLSA